MSYRLRLAQVAIALFPLVASANKPTADAQNLGLYAPAKGFTPIHAVWLSSSKVVFEAKTSSDWRSHQDSAVDLFAFDTATNRVTRVAPNSQLVCTNRFTGQAITQSGPLDGQYKLGVLRWKDDAFPTITTTEKTTDELCLSFVQVEARKARWSLLLEWGGPALSDVSTSDSVAMHRVGKDLVSVPPTVRKYTLSHYVASRDAYLLQDGTRTLPPLLLSAETGAISELRIPKELWPTTSIYAQFDLIPLETGYLVSVRQAGAAVNGLYRWDGRSAQVYKVVSYGDSSGVQVSLGPDDCQLLYSVKPSGAVNGLIDRPTFHHANLCK